AVERHLTEESLRESERRFATAFYSSPACLLISRAADGRFMYVNDQFVALFGYSRAEAVGQTTLSLGLVAPEERARLFALLDQRKAHDVAVTARARSGDTLNLLVWMDRIQILGEEC